MANTSSTLSINVDVLKQMAKIAASKFDGFQFSTSAMGNHSLQNTTFLPVGTGFQCGLSVDGKLVHLTNLIQQSSRQKCFYRILSAVI